MNLAKADCSVYHESYCWQASNLRHPPTRLAVGRPPSVVGGRRSTVPPLRSYIAVQPASTENAMPVTNVDSSEARNSAAVVISSGSARRFIA